MSEEKNPMTDQGNTYDDSGNPRDGYDGGNPSQNSEPGPRAQGEGNNDAPPGSASNPLPEQQNAYAEASNGLGYEQDQQSGANQTREPAAGMYGQAPGQTGYTQNPMQGMRVKEPAQEEQADSAQAQQWVREQQAGEVPGEQAGPVTGKNVAQAAGMEGYYGGTTQQEQEGQKVNVEQSHQTNTAQYKGKPGTKAPSPGQEQGTSWSQDMELSNSDVPARNPNSY